MLTKEQIDAFVADLETLSRKHRIAIGGCGCCGSPSLEEIPEKDLPRGYMIDGTEYLNWDWS